MGIDFSAIPSTYTGYKRDFSISRLTSTSQLKLESSGLHTYNVFIRGALTEPRDIEAIDVEQYVEKEPSIGVEKKAVDGEATVEIAVDTPIGAIGGTGEFATIHDPLGSQTGGAGGFFLENSLVGARLMFAGWNRRPTYPRMALPYEDVNLDVNFQANFHLLGNNAFIPEPLDNVDLFLGLHVGGHSKDLATIDPIPRPNAESRLTEPTNPIEQRVTRFGPTLYTNLRPTPGLEISIGLGLEGTFTGLYGMDKFDLGGIIGNPDEQGNTLPNVSTYQSAELHPSIGVKLFEGKKALKVGFSWNAEVGSTEASGFQHRPASFALSILPPNGWGFGMLPDVEYTTGHVDPYHPNYRENRVTFTFDNIIYNILNFATPSRNYPFKSVFYDWKQTPSTPHQRPHPHLKFFAQTGFFDAGEYVDGEKIGNPIRGGFVTLGLRFAGGGVEGGRAEDDGRFIISP
ncbi:MAG: hypothetical protein KKB81_06350 [Candidatus Margulisbacteria bacterium]|nr:hypothetical protein [Candidatus Margulisiibacteriota bacterium]MBU1021477.1 hypothetical protein [Candidatus Margulisiibacteriota bacterium]MBU1728562.1 hypothetical protein [Candidatus Margulisiibacteriota bacterium]MBU1955859.1 hypothetical protein [Candidatus Margulisiibacteriota bacterium]